MPGDRAIDWTKWSAIAEILGAVAILVTLLYLAIQTAQNTAAAQASTRQAILAEDRALLELRIQYPQLVILQGAKPGTLSDEQKVRLSSWLTIFVRNRENQFLQRRNEGIDEATLASYASVIVPILSYEITRAWWEQSTGQFDPDFVLYIDELLSDAPIVSSSVSRAMGID
jgi:hypothetical protein